MDSWKKMWWLERSYVKPTLMSLKGSLPQEERLNRLSGLMLAIVLAGLIAGCSDKPRSISDVVSSWAHLGMSLPPEQDVDVIRERLPGSLAALREGLTSDTDHIRMSSAYVAGKLGSRARPLVPVMLERLQTEPASIIRGYIAAAIARIGGVDSRDVARLQIAFRSEENEQAKTDIAGALVRLRSPEEEPPAWRWLMQSLAAFPPEPPAELEARQVFWERRWGAVEHLRFVQGKDGDLLPSLRLLETNPKTPRWVIDQQVAPAIAEIEGRKKVLAEIPGPQGSNVVTRIDAGSPE
jgi:hypothetical protein